MHPDRRLGSAILLAVAAALATAAGAAQTAALLRVTDAPRVEDTVAAVVLAAGTAVAGWYLATAVAWSACVAGRRLGRRWTAAESALVRIGAPLVRRTIAGALGATLGGAATLGVAAAADEVPDDLGWAARDVVTVGVLAPGPPTAHVVRPGETLWGIARTSLVAAGRPAADADVAAAWPLWYAANRDVVGTDPDLIRPGQVLTPPTSGGPR